MTHREIEELLPWYVNQTLPELERAKMERQVATTPEWQERLAEWQHLAQAVQAVEVTAPVPSPERFAALMAQIDAASEPPTPEPALSLWARLTTRLRALHQSWLDSPGLSQFALGLQCALIVLCLTGITLQWPWSSPTFYQTLSSQETTRATTRGQLRLVVADDMTTGELRILLGRIRATIVHGPSAMGVYTLTLSLDARSALPKALEQALEQALQTLRAHEHVTLAEPIL